MDGTTGLPLLTVQSQTAAEFWLEHLEPGSTFMLYLYAVNIKGLSAPVILPASTLKEAAKRTVPPTTDAFPGVASAVAMGAGASILLVASIAVAACIRCRRRQDTPSHPAVQSKSADLAEMQRGKDPPCVTDMGSTSHQIAASCNGRDEGAETAGFYHRPHRSRPPPGSQSVKDRRACLKLPPDFVPLSDIPESCV